MRLNANHSWPEDGAGVPALLDDPSIYITKGVPYPRRSTKTIIAMGGVYRLSDK